MDFQVGYHTPFVGTEIIDNPEKFNLEILYEDFEFHKFPFSDLILNPKEMSMVEYNNLTYFAYTDLKRFFTQSILKLDKSHMDSVFLQFMKKDDIGHIFVSKIWPEM